MSDVELLKLATRLDEMPDDYLVLASEFAPLARYFMSTVAELTRLRELLAGAYTVKPLEWSGGPYYVGANRFGLAAYGANTGWGWCCMENGVLKMHACESLDDGIDKAKDYDHARVTAPLVKVEVPS
jgi:hypothetical protein